MIPIVVNISGPAGSGKTTLARIIAARRGRDRPYYVRLHMGDGRGPAALRLHQPLEEMAGSVHSFCTPQRVFEQVPGEFQRVAEENRPSLMLVETDGAPALRHAYPYDVKVFILHGPSSLEEVFRSSEQAAAAISRAMDDTTQFAVELFGLTADGPQTSLPAPSDSAVFMSRLVESANLGVDEFLRTDVGLEIAARMQLTPDYHGMIDSDLVVFNEAVLEDDRVAEQCVRRIQQLLEQLRREVGRRIFFAACDPLDIEDPSSSLVLEKIESLIRAVR